MSMMIPWWKILFLILLIVVLIVGWYGYRFYRLLRISEGIIARTNAYSLPGSSGTTLLVLGDSTAVGVGAENPEESIAWQLSKYINAWEVENQWVSWAIVSDVASQIVLTRKKEYDYILLQIGGNDMTRLHDLMQVSRDYESLIENLPRHKYLIITSCGNLGGAQIFPRFIGYIYERVSRSYHTKFKEIVTRHGGIYVDIFDERAVDPFIREPNLYLAADLFHPSSLGYKYWFSKVTAQIWFHEN